MAGILVKVWPVGNFSTSSSKQVGDSLAYIENAEKTKCSVDGIEDKVLARNMTSEVRYVVNDVKTLGGTLIGTQNVTSVETAFDEMMEVKRFYKKEGGRIALHGVISLDENDSIQENIPRLMMTCQEVLNEVFSNNQAVFAVHTNTDNLHVHFFLNSVGLDGVKIHQDADFVRKVLQPCLNRVAEKYGLTPNTAWGRKKTEKKTVDEMGYGEKKALLKNLCDKAIENADTFDGFLESLKGYGVTPRTGKYLSLMMNGFKYPIRSGKLGDEYTVDVIVARISDKTKRLNYVSAGEHTENVAMKKTPYVDRRLKRYKDMSPVEKRRVLSLLKLGRNPWQEYYASSWQRRKIDEDMTRQKNVDTIIAAYSPSGSISAALSEMITRQKELSAEKKKIKENLKRYHAEAEIYKQMVLLMQTAFLYEETKKPEYRADYEKYKVLADRLSKYEKTPEEVADFLEEQKNELMYLNAQKSELSKQYRTVKNYGVDNRLIDGERVNSLYDLTGIKQARENAKLGIMDNDRRYIYSESSEVVLEVTTAPAVVEGKVVSETVVTVFYGDDKDKTISSLDPNFTGELFKWGTTYKLSGEHGWSQAVSTKSRGDAEERILEIEEEKRQKQAEKEAKQAGKKKGIAI